ncbi:dihydrodipicolinate synthase family protein [Rubinisphaera sp.]|uniref:dihydrodipicolinate synthase family protein n=1 Tax=Rubinisphaera sp. TaxID=2024857 RepID=UPI000C0E3981|nr:dihydrodipicolinate synthase family protein [Rubinisphaera sp.]MBV09437.1 N-acetylneuraminate lyase [Rubinisphaera sp.]HCS52809.1 N-acetylneuraminate lyase [Planctomycetaceae bacterium]|tara:strand:+ start:6193 stop:7128 length:936 start_codon:yes stop_codon:yes gene_type:complete
MVRQGAFLRGLIAATFTPLHDDGTINTAAIPEMVDHLVKQNIAGMYVLGSTGEGVSLTHEERCTIAEAFVEAAVGQLPVIIQCGCESLSQARLLATHAQNIGADAISAVSPVYFKPDSVETLVDSMAEIAAGAPDLPFYYYHIPSVTGVNLNMVEFLKLGSDRIPNLRGIKFTSLNVFEYQSCLEFAGDRFEILWGLDEMLLSGLAAGARAAVGSTYNFAAPIYHQLIQAFSQGNLNLAREQQSKSQELVRTFLPYGPRAAQKAIMSMVAVECGPTRLPVKMLSESQIQDLRNDLTKIGFFDWIASTRSEG